MKRILTAILVLAIGSLFGQGAQNTILKNFKPFPTPRTNYRPGTVYRVDTAGVNYFVKDVKSIKSYSSKEGVLTGRMTFSKREMLTLLNIEFDTDYVTAEVEFKNASREYNEQTNLDLMLWEEDVIDDLIVDERSSYFIIRETVASKEITYRFDEDTHASIITGSGNLKAKRAVGDAVIDFPYSMTKKFKEPKRLFYLDQKIGEDHYGD